ncbi:TetR/AcrR family transcriptional regulator [Belliella sp. DSM 111904]|uniref:TetR/AcrR family transcriptional regulator n=1 Tax=Belliella filtrata TaxID=2923435 RepID=A0ABS9UZ31_9BACT|nr:TetR/AcrR family transcriptional regulator [Belliella filtrata]MCH7409426.1 TetR/AcrR family transcriptional regulator [Belliella filtrata]
MGAQERVQKEKLILDTAIRLFTEKGFHGTKMDEVAKGANISKGLTYFYYKNKEDLYMAVTKKAFDNLKDIFRDIFRSKNKNGMDMLVDLISKYMDFSQEQRMYYEAILNFMGLMNQYNDKELRSQMDPLILESVHFNKLLDIHHDCGKIGIQIVSLGIKDGSIRPELQPEITFYTLWSMLIGYERLNGPINYEMKEIKIHVENWKPGFIKMMQDLLRGTIRPSRTPGVQGSLF